MMETTDFVSMLGIVSGVCGTIAVVCLAVGMMARFHLSHRDSNHAAPALNHANQKTKVLSSSSPTQHRHEPEDDNANPDVVPERSGNDNDTQQDISSLENI